MNVRQNTRGTAAIPASTIDECTISKGECTKTVVIAIHGTASLQSYQLAKHRKRGVLPSSGSLFETVPSLVFHTNCMQHSQGCFCILYLGFCQKRLEFSLSLSLSLSLSGTCLVSLFMFLKQGNFHDKLLTRIIVHAEFSIEAHMK